MRSADIDPMDPRVLERNYDYAQRNVRLLSMWYEREIEEMVALLARHGIELSRNDRHQFGPLYRAIRESTERLE